MKKTLLLPLLLILASCSSLKVSYDYDSQSDFTKFKTFAFTDDATPHNTCTLMYTPTTHLEK